MCTSTFKITYTYPCGFRVTKELPSNAVRDYGVMLNGKRPIVADITGKASKDFLYKGVKFSMHPLKCKIIINGVTVLNINSDKRNSELY